MELFSHVQCGFNYFDPYGHEGKGQEQTYYTDLGHHGNMGLVGYDWAPHGVDMVTHDHEHRNALYPIPEPMYAAGRLCNFRIFGYRDRATDRS